MRQKNTATPRLICTLALSLLLPLAPGSSSFATEEAASSSAEDRANAEMRTNAIKAQGKEAFIRVASPGSWFSDSIKGKDVVTVDGNAAGRVSDILIGPDGTVQGLLLSRGGFLGLGATTVAVDVRFFELLPGASQSRADQISKTYPATAPAPAALAPDAPGQIAAGGTIKLGPDGLPQHLVLRLSLEELDGAPPLEGR